jgi:hypothetical protein
VTALNWGHQKENNMTPRNIAYWLTTVLFVLPISGSAAMYFTTPDLQLIGYPVYFWTILGTWKLLGVAALLAPGLALVKEWAYAGFFFTLTGASASHLLYGDGVGGAVAPLVIGTLVAASYLLRPASRRLVGVPTLPEAKPLAQAATAH